MNHLLLTFLLFTSLTLPLDKTEGPSIHDKDQQFVQMFGDKMLSSFTTKKGVPLIHLPLKKRILCLVIDYWSKLTKEQLIFLFELALNDPGLLKDLYYRQGRLMKSLILTEGSQKLKLHFFYDVLLPSTGLYYGIASIDHELEWKRAINFYDPFESITVAGPLFSDFDKRFWPKTALYTHKQNFEGLLPDIAEYVAEEYKQDRIVLFHAHAAIWIGLGALYRALDEYKHGRQLSSTFFHTRFWTHSPLSEEEITKKEFKWERNSNRNVLLFTTLHLADGYRGNNTLEYILESYDQISREGISVTSWIKEMFMELDMDSEYQKLLEKKPTIFQELRALCHEATNDQGGYGQLLVISLPKKLASKLSYLSDNDGERTFISIDGIKTSDTVTIAEHFGKTPFNKQFVLKLSEDIINPEAAKKAGVKIVAFDPAAYWRTEKYRKVEAKIQEIIELIRERRDEESAITRESPF